MMLVDRNCFGALLVETLALTHFALLCELLICTSDPWAESCPGTQICLFSYKSYHSKTVEAINN